MIIETKYNIGDKVWTVKGGKARVGRIQSLCFLMFMALDNLHTRMIYDISSDEQILYHIDESDIFPTKEELLKSL